VDLFHFSHDPSITRFVPHVPATNPSQPASVWAIDAEHAPLYWFPRNCPRVTAWPRTDGERVEFEAAFCTVARRVHAIELGWLPEMQSAELYRYRFDSAAFRPWVDASGQWVSHTTVEPLDVTHVVDLVGLHIAAGIELRAVPDLRPVRTLAMRGPWDFSIVRFHLARPSPERQS